MSELCKSLVNPAENTFSSQTSNISKHQRIFPITGTKTNDSMTCTNINWKVGNWWRAWCWSCTEISRKSSALGELNKIFKRKAIQVETYRKEHKPVNLSMRDWVSLRVNETDMVVVKKTKSDIRRTPHFVTK